MGGHGGLNILPQKSWNVYNFDNREKVRKDEEAAAKEEQLKQEQIRKRDAEFRLDKLKAARGLPSASAVSETADTGKAGSSAVSKPKSKHINLFEGLKVFPFLGGEQEQGGEDGKSGGEGSKKRKRERKEEAAPKVMLPEDEKYRLGYGLAGKGVKAPWYLSKRSNGESDGEEQSKSGKQVSGGKNSGAKKTMQELREERLNREKKEKERERALLMQKNNQRHGAGSRAGRLFQV